MRHEARASLDMSISQREFARLLHRLPRTTESLREESAFAAPRCRAWRLQLATGAVHIVFCPLPPRRLGAFLLPRARVRLNMAALPPQARAAFLARFRRHYLRGGG